MPWTLLASLAAAALLFAESASAEPRVQEYLESLRIGDTLEQVQIIYPPTRQWTKFREPGGGVVRMIVERSSSKWFPSGVGVLRLGMRRDRLVHIQAVYDKDEARRKPLENLVADLSLLYGEPRRAGETYFWLDGRLVMSASNVEVASEVGGGKEIRTSLELMDRRYFKPRLINVIE